MSSTRAKSPRSQTPPSHGPQPESRSSSRLALVGVTVVVVLALLGWVLARDGDEAATAVAGGDVEVAHVHGLGVDPADGVLYAGTHYGLIRLPEQGDPRRVADRVQDFMGFTVAGPNHFLASGHPGEGQEGPSALGLIESTDGGQTWESLSLAGEADFHSLEARHGLVYGLNAMTGQFLVSEDKQTWDERGAVPMADFAVSPEDPDVILATTEQGLVRSGDGGREWALVPGAPLLQLVSWADDGTLVGVQPDGAVRVSTDDGGTWEARGEMGGQPHALVASSGDEIFAAIDGAIVASDDGGRTFTPRFQE